MSEPLKARLIAFAAVAFALTIIGGSIGVGLLGFGFVLFGLGAGFAFLALATAGLIFAGLFTVRVLIPLVRLIGEDSAEQ